MNPYIECVDKNFQENGIATRIMTCPNCSGDLLVEMIRVEWEALIDAQWVFPAYSYWGGVGEMIAISKASAGTYSQNVLRDLTLDAPSPRRLLMTESFYLDSRNEWHYNHGQKGWAYCFSWIDTPLDTLAERHQRLDGEQDATGRSQLFGDGRVEWQSIPLKFEDNLPSEITELGGVGFSEDQWNGPGSGYIMSEDGYDYAYY